MLSALASCGRQRLEEPIELIIANDLHYISPSLLDNDISDDSLYSRDGKLVRYSSEITDAFLAEVMEKKPKALILAGDLTLNGARLSHEALAEKLEAVKAAGIDVLVIPGNHDIDQTAVDYSGEVPTEATALSSAEFIELYEPLIPQGAARDTASQSFVYTAAEKLWVLMLDTNSYGQCYVKDETLVWIEKQLQAASTAGIDVIAVSHQNLYAHSTLLSFGYQLYNADKLIALYEKYGVICNLSGHIHIQSCINDKKVPELVTSSLAITGNHYGLLSYDGRELSYKAVSADVSAHAQSLGSTNADLLGFAEYATRFFVENARLQAQASLSDTAYSASETDLMAEAYAKINCAYFEGRPLDPTPYTSGIELWRNSGKVFFSSYIDSMLATAERERRYLTIVL